jgi:putative transposase
LSSTYTNLLYHILFSTKSREPIITADWKEELYRYLGGIIRAEGGVCLEIGGIEDHVHILAKLKPTISVAEMLKLIKANSSKWVNDHKVIDRGFGWQVGYAAFSVRESQVEAVRHYVRNQEQHHRKQTYQEELIALLERHGIEYDPRYLRN